MYTLDPLDPLASVSIPVDSCLDNLLSGQELISPVKQVTSSVIPSMVSSVSDSEKTHCKMIGSLHSTSHASSAVDQPMTGAPLTDSGFSVFIHVSNLCCVNYLYTFILFSVQLFVLVLEPH